MGRVIFDSKESESHGECGVTLRHGGVTLRHDGVTLRHGGVTLQHVGQPYFGLGVPALSGAFASASA